MASAVVANTTTAPLATTTRSRCGVAANVGRMVPNPNSLVIDAAAMTPHSKAHTTVVPPSTLARSLVPNSLLSPLK